MAWLVTALGVLGLGVEAGAGLVVAMSIGTFLWRASRPHIAVVGRVADSEHFRNERRFAVTESKIAAPAFDRLPCTDFGMEEDRPLQVGSISIDGLHTPGHTDGHFAYVTAERVFTGDALLIDGCGRTDFQNGDSEALYRSVTEKLFALAGETLVYPAHDYRGRHVSSIAQEKTRNPRLGSGETLAHFQQITATLNLPYPKFIDYAVPGNRGCGVCPSRLPDGMQK